ncbi:hypothetical protein ACUNER_25030 [Serratia sp. IR-2025]
MQIITMVISVTVLNEIFKIQESIFADAKFESIVRCFSESMCELHKTNPHFYNHIFKASRISTLTVLMNYILSGEVTTLSEFYNICNEYGYSGKNNAVSLIDFLVHTNRLRLIKGVDRRKKTPELTEKGMASLKAYMMTLVKPLTIYDASLTEEVIDSNGYYKNFYSRASLLLGIQTSSFSFNTEDEALDMYNKSGGMIFMLMIYNDLLKKEVKLNTVIKKSYFVNLSYDIGVSSSHVNNLLGFSIKSKFIRKDSRGYVITREFIVSVERFASFYLAFAHFLIHP